VPDPHRDAFGRLIGPVERLDFAGRVDALRRLQGRLAAAPDRESQWLAKALLAWLRDGGDIPALLGVRPAPGSTLTAQRIVALEGEDVARCRAVAAAGGVRAAARQTGCSAATVARARARRGVAPPTLAGDALDDAGNNTRPA